MRAWDKAGHRPVCSRGICWDQSSSVSLGLALNTLAFPGDLAGEHFCPSPETAADPPRLLSCQAGGGEPRPEVSSCEAIAVASKPATATLYIHRQTHTLMDMFTRACVHTRRHTLSHVGECTHPRTPVHTHAYTHMCTHALLPSPASCAPAALSGLGFMISLRSPLPRKSADRRGAAAGSAHQGKLEPAAQQPRSSQLPTPGTPPSFM